MMHKLDQIIRRDNKVILICICGVKCKGYTGFRDHLHWAESSLQNAHEAALRRAVKVVGE